MVSQTYDQRRILRNILAHMYIFPFPNRSRLRFCNCRRWGHIEDQSDREGNLGWNLAIVLDISSCQWWYLSWLYSGLYTPWENAYVLNENANKWLLLLNLTFYFFIWFIFNNQRNIAFRRATGDTCRSGSMGGRDGCRKKIIVWRKEGRKDKEGRKEGWMDGWKVGRKVCNIYLCKFSCPIVIQNLRCKDNCRFPAGWNIFARTLKFPK